ncbi:uncharacterized protein LOC142353269 [Convolutriloba macropyga]|uniref:uncharacterized protein LOC142353269 n=1 Tax=Convolutriloba macropyga TaxID=536237 RepID=UPI003F51E605
MVYIEQDEELQFYSAEYEPLGGRSCRDLIHLANYASNFSHILVIVGDNDVNFRSVDFILDKYKEFIDAVWPSKVKITGHMRRKDLDPIVVSNNNAYLSQELVVHYKSAKMVKWHDFDDDSPFHFYRFGEGYRHLAALILSVFKEFDESW